MYRLVERMGGEPYDGAAVSARAREWTSAMTDAVPQAGDDAQLADEGVPTVLHPYSGFSPRTEHEAVSRHLRLFSMPDADERFDVLILGGSVSGNFGRHGAKELERLLLASEGFQAPRLHFFNYGRGGYKQPQQVTLLNYLLAIGFRPDAVINLDGFNEVALASYNHHVGAHPLHPSFPHWAAASNRANDDPQAAELRRRIEDLQARALALTRRADDLSLWSSALLGSWTFGRLHTLRSEYQTASGEFQAWLAGEGAWPEMRGPPFRGSREEAVQLAVDAWSRASVSMHAACEAQGIAYLHVLQPTLHDPGSKTWTAEEEETSYAHEAWIEGVHVGYPKLREEGARLAERGVPFVDASRIFVDVEPTLYYDACHFRAPGHGRIAELLAPRLVALLPN